VEKTNTMETEEWEVEEALRRQDEALALLERLRIMEPATAIAEGHPGGGRRDFRRWPAPRGVTVELHDGEGWQIATASDLGIGGVRVTALPADFAGPVPVRLKSAEGMAVLALADLMWRDGQAGAAGLRFEFLDPEEHDQWTVLLIDALLAKYALV
jgi:hypothetical protein